ncbi:ATP-binding cassette domain-containing protein [Acidiferrimicrobium sp. IK]|uniref:ABC transporter ATP-binding protein n=1 Tax=Acidiferrimicrobium sp. IK TaxID=2871700 RepID=UPI0021CB53FA|nr:ATP-binding cassette domain-containing protein [Acidiferrimicrobium sp. IK]MCU4183894.1 ATP-binding cassette domain-containing protein [Acidiferrimicrobium sp. IK]
MTLLDAKSLTVKFGGVAALNALSFHVDPGEFVGVLGANGSGKSTLLDVLSGLRSSSGSVTFRGRELARVPAHARHRLGISRSYQNLELSPALSVRESLRAGSRVRGRRSVEEIARVSELFSLEDVGAERVGVLPYGVRKRVELGRAFLCQPALVLLDEPMAGLNDAEKDRVASVLREIGAEPEPPAIVLVEHDVSVVAALSSRIVAIDLGSVIAEGNPRDVIAAPAVQRAYLGV